MSYNIDHCEYIKGGPLKIKRGKAAELLEELEDDLPESHLLDELDLRRVLDQEELLEIEHPAWSGCSSGNTYDILKEKVLPHTIGNATILFIWEGGDSRTALLVKDGTVTDKKVKITTE